MLYYLHGDYYNVSITLQNGGAAFMDSKKARKIVSTTANITAWTVGGALRLVLRIFVTALMVFLITGLLFACIFAYYVKTELNPKLKVTLEDASLSLSSTIWYTDADGVAQELKTLSSRENRIWVDYENLPEGMEHALVAIEDHRFYTHKGVDWYRTAGAFAQMFLSMSNDFGGSTITQQLIKNNTQNNADLVSRKLLEIFQALELEKTYTKEEIVEWYLNTVYFGEGCYGVYTAAQTYFGKDVWELSLAECASIVGITNNPSKYDPFIANTITDRDLDLTLSCREWNKYRQELILSQMYQYGYITYDEYVAAKNEELNFVRAENEPYVMEINSFYVETVIDDVIRDLMTELDINEKTARDKLYYGGLQIYCCMDPKIQAIVDGVYQDVDNLPKPYYTSKQQLQSGMMVIDPYTGMVKAIAGAVGEKTVNDAWNYATDSKRQVGSSIKPLSVYGPALEYGLITQNTLVNDSADIKLDGTVWYPYNSPNVYAGIITIREALKQSKNTVAAQIVDKLTPAEAYKFLTERLGFTSLEPSDADYAPMAEGALTIGATVREMSQAYTAFVNNGTMTYARTYTKVLDSNGNVVLNNDARTINSFTPNTAANICNMLENAVSPGGTGAGAYFSGVAVGGKTGTTADNKDRYFVGITPYYVAAVWTGYDMPETMYFYSNPAVVIWKSVMQKIHEGLPYQDFPAPSIGKATNIFGNLEDELKEQEEAKNPKPTEEPTETETPEETTSPEPTEEPTETPAETQPPVEETEVPAETPVAEETPQPEQPVEPEPPEITEE
ncbi:MAG: transglycosylase [Ruminococcaceae bacterium]|nr:transglycosylase [Oscillospiraceae bacterium]